MAACAYEIAAGLFPYGKIRVDMNFPVKLQTMTAATCGKGKLGVGTVCASGIKKPLDVVTVYACGVETIKMPELSVLVE